MSSLVDIRIFVQLIGHVCVSLSPTGGMDGRALSLDFNGHIYLFEFKVVEQTPLGSALAQLQARRLAECRARVACLLRQVVCNVLCTKASQIPGCAVSARRRYQDSTIPPIVIIR